MTIGVITGDIVNSIVAPPEDWLGKIKYVFKRNKIPRDQWEIFRGDMFQVEVPVEDILQLALELKATIKQNKNLDVRMSLGIGEKVYEGNPITESNGEAYILSGRGFEKLKKGKLKIESPWHRFNLKWEVIIELSLLTMDNWHPVTARIFATSIQYKDQKKIANLLGKSQSSISEGLKRAGKKEMNKMLVYFKNDIAKQMEGNGNFN